MPIYTKKGDKGTTAFITDPQVRVSKASLKVVALGTIDELNSFTGLAKSLCEDQKLIKVLARIQKNLLTMGSIIAGSNLKFKSTETKFLEKQIDNWTLELPKLSNFVLPGGSQLSGSLHVCRSVSRRAERKIVALSESEEISKAIKQYANRLSDFFFTAARFADFQKGIADDVWSTKK